MTADLRFTDLTLPIWQAQPGQLNQRSGDKRMNRCFVLTASFAAGLLPALAVAQSSVSLTGVIDVSGKYVKADGQPRQLSEATDGLSSSQLTFRGVEDLGGGLLAGFTLNSGFNPDTGATNAKFWNRRSTVSVMGKFGEIRLGRDYIPTFYALAVYDAMGIVGIGATVNVRQLYPATRMDNSIGYFLPSDLGGFNGQLMVAASEGGSAGDKPGRHVGGTLGYAAGNLSVLAGAAQQSFTLASGLAVPGNQQTTYNLGASWDFGFAKVMGFIDREKLATKTENTMAVGSVFRFGQSEIRGGYDRSRFTPAIGKPSTIDQVKIGYVYNLSKRTALYTTASRLTNKDATRQTLGGAAGPTLVGGKSQGAEFGLRHSF